MNQEQTAGSDVTDQRIVGPGRPLLLRCEARDNPLGVDEKQPRLSWRVNDSRRRALQTAYQVRVARCADDLDDAAKCDWDSGRVESDRSFHVEYDGPPLESRTRYSWTVRTWDREGQASPWAEPAFWEMGLWSRSEWDAEWITSDVGKAEPIDLPMGDWIWCPSDGDPSRRAFLRRLFHVRDDVAVERALIHLTSDSTFHLFLNGRQIGHQALNCEIVEYDLAALVRKGSNILAVDARGHAGPYGLTVGARIDYSDGACLEIRSDQSWLSSPSAPGAWKGADFDAGHWQPAFTVARYGDEPWGIPPRKAPPGRSVCLRRSFTLPAAPVRAIAYVTGLGLYELHVNNRRVGADIFTPGWTKYDRRVQYQTYDVTDLLQEGPNAVGAIMGNGWWAGGLGLGRGSVYQTSPGTPRLIMRMDVTCEDGTSHVITTDRDWTSHISPILENTFYHGETYDARLEMPGWAGIDHDESGWKPVTTAEDPCPLLVANKEPPIRVTGTLSPVSISEPMDGAFVFDFGQNHAGWCKLRVDGSVGTRIQLRFAERLNPDGTLYTDTLVGARNTDVYVLKGAGPEEWEPRFTYRGYRYVEMTGYPGRPTADCLTSKVIHSAPDMTGRFECSDELLNRLHRNIVWSQRSNLHSVPTDCPQRDERLGWMGDAQVFAPTACWNMEMCRFFSKWMDDIADSQGPDGHVTNVAPVAVVSGPAAPGWGDAVVVIPWVLYRYYGDLRIVERHYETMRQWVEYMRANSEGNLYEREGYGDWVAVAESPKAPIGSAYYYLCAMRLAGMAGLIGRPEDAREYSRLAEKIAEAYHATHYDRQAKAYQGGTQTANLLPLAFGITPPADREDVLESIVSDIEMRHGHLSTGFLGTAYLLPTLAAMGRIDIAWRLLTQRSRPSWGYMIEHGATTMWELWDGDTADPPMNSHNHFALGAVGQWLYETVAGLGIDESHPGFGRFVIEPMPAVDLNWARAEYECPAGLIRIAWRAYDDGGRFILKATIPANTRAEVRLPWPEKGEPAAYVDDVPILGEDGEVHDVDGVRRGWIEAGRCVLDVGAGTYEFRIELGELL